jgi:F-type H+-transporting ATPase subunit delta
MERRSLARPYARAFYDHARARDDVAGWERFLDESAALLGDVRLRTAMADPRRTPAAKLELLARLLGLGDDDRRRACRLLLEHRRLDLLPSIREEFQALRARDEGWIEVEVTTARETSLAALEPLARALETRWKRRPRLRVRSDPTLLAGARVRVGDTVLDVSLRGRLARLAESVS